MNKLQIWILRKIAKQVVLQGRHKEKIIYFYGVLVAAARDEFTEDNKQTIDNFLTECHEIAVKENLT